MRIILKSITVSAGLLLTAMARLVHPTGHDRDLRGCQVAQKGHAKTRPIARGSSETAEQRFVDTQFQMFKLAAPKRER